MQLKTYREHNGLTLKDVARMLSDAGMRATHETTVRRHETGKREPEIRTIEAYRRVTKGAVTFDDWAALAEQTRITAKPPKSTGVVTK